MSETGVQNPSVADETWTALHGILSAIGEDYFHFASRLQDDDSQTSRRAYVRTVVTFLEGAITLMRTGTVAFLDALKELPPECRPHITPADTAVLSERTYRLNEKGEAKGMPMKLSTAESLRFHFDLVSKIAHLRNPLDPTSRGWSDLRATIKVRDRLTHPRIPNSMAVSDEELVRCKSAETWFSLVITKLLFAVGYTVVGRYCTIVFHLERIAKQEASWNKEVFLGILRSPSGALPLLSADALISDKISETIGNPIHRMQIDCLRRHVLEELGVPASVVVSLPWSPAPRQIAAFASPREVKRRSL